MSEFTESREKLLADLKAVIADADELLNVTAESAGGKISEVRTKVKSRIEDVRTRIADSEFAATAKQMSKSADTFVHENPWKSAGIAAGVGLIIGLLISRR